MAVKNNIVLGTGVLFGFVGGVKASAGVRMRKALDVGVVRAAGNGPGRKTERGGGTGYRWVRPDDGWRRPEGSRANRGSKGGDHAGASTSLQLNIIETEAAGEEVSVNPGLIFIDNNGPTGRADESCPFFNGGPVIGAAEPVSLGSEAEAWQVLDDIAGWAEIRA